MRHFFTVSVLALVALFGACSTNPTTPTATTTGEIYGETKLYNEYSVVQNDRSGLTVQLLDQGNVKQTIVTPADGMFSFKNVPAGVYEIRFFKQGYVWGDGKTDSLVAKNIQFVGNGRFYVDEFNYGYRHFEFYSTAEPDSSAWALKPIIRYEVKKNIEAVHDIFIRDSSVKIKVQAGNGFRDSTYYIKIYGDGTKETRKIHFTVDYERALPMVELKRTVVLSIRNDSRQSPVNIVTDANVLFGEFEYTSPNSIIRDLSGKEITYSEGGGSRSIINVKDILVQASSTLPSNIKRRNQPNQIVKTQELKLSLTD